MGRPKKNPVDVYDLGPGWFMEECVLTACGELGTATVEKIAKRSGYTIEEVLPVLERLKACGWAERSGAGWRFIPLDMPY